MRMSDDVVRGSSRLFLAIEGNEPAGEKLRATNLEAESSGFERPRIKVSKDGSGKGLHFKMHKSEYRGLEERLIMTSARHTEIPLYSMYCVIVSIGRSVSTSSIHCNYLTFLLSLSSLYGIHIYNRVLRTYTPNNLCQCSYIPKSI